MTTKKQVVMDWSFVSMEVSVAAMLAPHVTVPRAIREITATLKQRVSRTTVTMEEPASTNRTNFRALVYSVTLANGVKQTLTTVAVILVKMEVLVRMV